MNRWLLLAALSMTLLIGLIVVAANTGRLPTVLERMADFPGGDKWGHFLLFGALSYLLNRSAISLYPKRNPGRLVLGLSLFLSILIALEEWSQSLFPLRTMSLVDFLASFLGVMLAAVLAYRTRS